MRNYWVQFMWTKWNLTPDFLLHLFLLLLLLLHIFLSHEVRNSSPPLHLLFLTFKISSNSPPLVQEEGDVTPKVGCMVSNYSPRLSCSRREHWSGSITPPCPLLPPSYPPPATAVSPSTQPSLVPPHPSSSDPLCQPPTPYTISHQSLTSHWSSSCSHQP